MLLKPTQHFVDMNIVLYDIHADKWSIYEMDSSSISYILLFKMH